MTTDPLISIAAELVGCVHDYGPDAVAEVLAKVPADQHDAFHIVLAQMIDPSKTPKQLLAWMSTPVKSRKYTPPGFNVKRRRSKFSEHVESDREQVERFRLNGLSVRETAERLGITPRTVERHRAVNRARLLASETEAA